MNSIAEHLIIAVALMLVIIVSRVFQSYVALALGDDTPKLNGSTSFNPINHIDLMGFVFFVFFKWIFFNFLIINLHIKNNSVYFIINTYFFQIDPG